MIEPDTVGKPTIADAVERTKLEDELERIPESPSRSLDFHVRSTSDTGLRGHVSRLKLFEVSFGVFSESGSPVQSSVCSG